MIKTIILITVMTCVVNFTEESILVTNAFSSPLLKFLDHRQDAKHVWWIECLLDRASL